MFWRSTVYFWCCKEKGYLREALLMALKYHVKKVVLIVFSNSFSQSSVLASKQQAELGLWMTSPSTPLLSPFFFLFEAIFSVTLHFTHHTRVTYQDCWLSLLLSTFPKWWGTNVSIKVPLISLNLRKNMLSVLQIHAWFHEKKLSENESPRHRRGDMSNRESVCIFLFNIIPQIKDPGSRTKYTALKRGGGILYSQ